MLAFQKQTLRFDSKYLLISRKSLRCILIARNVWHLHLFVVFLLIVLGMMESIKAPLDHSGT